MCYIVLLSTSAPDDLSAYNTDLVRYNREEVTEPSQALLENAHSGLSGRLYVAVAASGT